MIGIEKITGLLSREFNIGKIVLENFIISDSDDEMAIYFEIVSSDNSMSVIKFCNVSGLNISSAYHVYSKNPSITIVDISDYQWESVKYRIEVEEDTMKFCCSEIELDG